MPMPMDARYQTVGRVEFQTARQLMDGIEKLRAGVLNLDEVYLKDENGEELRVVELQQEVLSDGSVVFNLVIAPFADPNS